MADQAETFAFELVSPEARLLETPATKAIIPGEEGHFGVLPLHSPLVASIRPGVVEVYTEDEDEPKRIFIAGGFADVTATNCTVLAEEAVNVEDLDQAELEKSISDLTEDLAMAGDDIEKKRIARKLAVAKARLEAVTGQIQL